MRLIDADKINFEEVFGGQSDFAKDLRNAAQELIDIQPTAFDKERVKQELEIASKLYRISEKDCEFAIPQNIAFELIEKGVIE